MEGSKMSLATALEAASSSEPAALECWHDPAHALNRFQSPTLVVKEEMTLDNVMALLADHVPGRDA
jgi:hypothetical protein